MNQNLRNREDRLARQLANRHSPEWRAAGERLAADRAAAEAARLAAAARELAARKERERIARIDGDPRRLDREVHKLVRRLEVALEDARGDYPDLSDDDLAYALWEGVRLGAPTVRVRRLAEIALWGAVLHEGGGKS